MPVIPKIQNPENRRMIRGEVVRVVRTTPHFATVTVGGADLAHLDYMGFDQSVRLFLRRPGQADLRMPTANNIGWAAQYFLIPGPARPLVRNYTVRRFDRSALEADIEFVIHGDRSPASRWAGHVEPGEPIGLYPEGTAYRLAMDGAPQLIVADESGVPAALAVLERLGAGARATAIMEVPTAADVRVVDTAADVDVQWVDRSGDPDPDGAAVPGRRALDALARSELPVDLRHAFVVGESGLATGARRHLTTARGLDKKNVVFVGYWKHGRSGPS